VTIEGDREHVFAALMLLKGKTAAELGAELLGERLDQIADDPDTQNVLRLIRRERLGMRAVGE
jgi:hypothetical protein